MRIAHIIDPLIGIIPDVNMTEAQDAKWQRDHMRAFEKVCASAVGSGADALLITGRLFAESFVTDADIAKTLGIIGEQPCTVVWLPDKLGAKCLRRAAELPENLFLPDAGSPEFVLGDAVITLWTGSPGRSGKCSILLIDETMAVNAINEAGTVFPELHYALSGDRAFVFGSGSVKTEKLAKMENTGFDDTEKSGYYLTDITNGTVTGREKINSGIYSFRTLRVEAATGDDIQSVCEKCSLAAADVTQYDFVRIILNGLADADSFVRAEHIREIMKESFFCLEVFSGCGLDADADAYRGDISLESEFVRGVFADSTLSDAEKSRIIQCGRSALRGKELSE